ncbi:hypothetical protein U1Q18_033093 [Sarracenia purpurea var. burkii]
MAAAPLTTQLETSGTEIFEINKRVRNWLATVEPWQVRYCEVDRLPVGGGAEVKPLTDESHQTGSYRGCDESQLGPTLTGDVGEQESYLNPRAMAMMIMTLETSTTQIWHALTSDRTFIIDPNPITSHSEYWGLKIPKLIALRSGAPKLNRRCCLKTTNGMTCQDDSRSAKMTHPTEKPSKMS